MSLCPADLPSPHAPSGVDLGWYRVRIWKVVDGEEIISARYDSETVLG